MLTLGNPNASHTAQQNFRYRGKSVHRAAACPKKDQLDGGSDAAVVAEALADRENVVLAQAEELLDIEFGHPGGKRLRWAGSLRSICFARLRSTGFIFFLL
ncbi:hypothetical protein QTH97_34260 [Variovorax sp. J22R24]|nr:hypothetical protein [Variovorax sp. J22R24]MDM0110014.1 hypothetical protein [Variovorax sp. J22R24]